MTMLRALVVDDEPIARRVLLDELETVEGIEVIGQADCGSEALRLIAASLPDLVFLDLQMPDMSGFEVVARLEGGHLPVVIVVTAFDQYALKAFDAGAVDYLLKPVSPARLQQAVLRARQLRASGAENARSLVRLQQAAHPGPAPMRKIVGRIGEEYFLLDVSEIVAFQAEEDSVWIVTARNRFLATETLRDLSLRLESAPFRRIHRNALVNVSHVRKMAALTSRRWLLTMDNGQEFIVSKRQAGLVHEILGR
jgi:DNA-binding LytR/AlgR family response regulator